jgi:hypothetical protein
MSERLIERLRRDDITQLDFNPDFTIQEISDLCNALKYNSSVSTVDISWGNENAQQKFALLNAAMSFNTSITSITTHGDD